MIGLGQRCLPGDAEVWAPSLRKGQGERAQLLGAVGALFTRGVAIDWAGLEAGRPRRSLPLPTYPFERQRCWIDAGAPAHRSRAREALPLGARPCEGREAIGDRLYQQAYWVGRHGFFELGTVSAHMYLEVDATGSTALPKGVMVSHGNQQTL